MAESEVARIKGLWRKCWSDYGANGEWLFADYSIADAMFAPVALRFSGYGIPLSGVEAGYVDSVLKHQGIIEWVEAGKLETEVIDANEIEAWQAQSGWIAGTSGQYHPTGLFGVSAITAPNVT